MTEKSCKAFSEKRSGINEFTEDYHNYYEAGHYRPLLGNKLLERIYKRQ